MAISNPHIEVKDAPAGGWFGAREEAQLPVRSYAASPPPVANDSPFFTSDVSIWIRRARRTALDIAVVLAVMTALPAVFVATNQADDWRFAIDVGAIRAKAAAVEPIRAFMVPVDPAITPLEAGAAFSALNPPRGSAAGFRLVSGPHPAMTWQRLTMPQSLFPSSSRPYVSNTPNSQTILQAAAKGFSQDEIAYLRQLATAPVWQDFDRVARAGSMDVIGARFVLPFSANASASNFPAGIYTSTKEMAYAAVSRAAYHLAIGQRDSAETILRSIVSFGFNLADNGSGLIDQLIGRVIIGIGRDGLENFFVVTNDPRVAAVRLDPAADPPASFTIPDRSGVSHSESIDDMRRELIARATDSRELQGVRYASLELLQTSACTNVRELLFGPRADVTDAFRRAKTELARYPSQQALIDLIQRSPETDPISGIGYASTARRLLYGTSAIAGTVLHNPRLAACMWHVTEGKLGF